MKKALSFALALGMAVSMCTVVAMAEAPEYTFTYAG